MKTVIVVADQPWPKPGKFEPALVPAGLRIEQFDINAHWQLIGYFLLLNDGTLVVDGVGLQSHAGLAEMYSMLLNANVFDQTKYKAFVQTIVSGGVWPPKLLLFMSSSFPVPFDPETQTRVIETFAPCHHLEFSTEHVFFDKDHIIRRLLEG